MKINPSPGMMTQPEEPAPPVRSSVIRSTLLLFLLVFPVYFMFLVFHEGGHALHTLAMGGPVSIFYVHPFPMAGYALPPFDWENVWFHASGAAMVLLVSLLIFILCWKRRSVSLLPLVMFFPWTAIGQGFVMLMVMDDFNNIAYLTGLSPIIFQVTGLVASLVLGFFWGVWHLPSFFVSSTVQSGLSLPMFLLFGLCLAILMTWIFHHTGGSVLAAVLFHYTINISFSIIGAPMQAFGLELLVLATLVVVLDKKLGWFNKPYSRNQGVHENITLSVERPTG